MLNPMPNHDDCRLSPTCGVLWPSCASHLTACSLDILGSPWSFSVMLATQYVATYSNKLALVLPREAVAHTTK